LRGALGGPEFLKHHDLGTGPRQMQGDGRTDYAATNNPDS
jgi:hypothetical protein